MATKSAPRPLQVNDWIGAGRAFVRGIPIGGELMDEGLAAADATFGGDRSKSWGERWNSNVDEQRAYDAAYDARHPYISAAMQTAGNFAVPGGAILGAVPRATKLFSLAGRAIPVAKSALLRKMGEHAAEGAAEGVADGFLAGRGGFEERARHAGNELMRSAAWGALKPVMSGALGREIADGTSVRQGLRERRRVDGILGRIAADGPLMGLIPLPTQVHRY